MPRILVMFALVLLSALGAFAAFPPVGEPAPDFWLRNQDGNGVTLKDFRGKWVVLYFYPRDFSRACSLEAKNFQRDLPQYEQAGAVVVGISTDGPDVHKGFCDLNKLTFPLLSDTNAEVSTQYNSFTQLKTAKIAARNTFLISPDGKLVKVFEKVNPASHSADVLAALAEMRAAKP